MGFKKDPEIGPNLYEYLVYDQDFKWVGMEEHSFYFYFLVLTVSLAKF